MLMKADQCCLLVIDVQERLAPAMHDANRVTANTAVLMQAAARLGVPALVSEQYPKGLGATVPELAQLTADGMTAEKVSFSCLGDAGYTARFRDLNRPQAVVCGIEAHVCVLQTVLDLLERGVPVYVVADATASRTPENAAAALQRMGANGAQIVTTEMVVFEWLGRAGTPEFKELSALVK